MADIWMFGLAVVFSACVLYSLIKLVSRGVRFWRKMKMLSDIPCFPPHWLWGHILEYPGPNEAGLAWQREHTAKFPYVSLALIGPFIIQVLPSHPEMVKEILRTSEPKGQMVYHLIEPWVGDGLLLSKGSKWWRNRRLLTPAFHFEILKPYMNINNQASDILVGKFQQACTEGRSMELFTDISLLTLDVMLRCAFSYSTNCQTLGDQHPYVYAVRQMSSLATERFFQFWLHSDFLYFLTPKGRQFKKYCNHVHQISADIIKKRKAELLTSDEDKTTSSQKRYLDFLDILLTAHDASGEGLTDSEIRDEVDTFLFEGHDTTSSAICWTLCSLAEHPEHQRRIQEELDEVLKGRESEDILWEDLPKLTYLNLCIKESLRLHSPVPMVQRQTTQTLTLGKHTIPPDTLINVVIYNIHHNPLIWDNSMEYRPDRFTLENCEKRDPYAFVPFSAGPRNCIGQNFAMHEIKVVISRILYRFNLELDPNHKVEKVIELVMRSKNGIWVKAKPRSR
ncbi:ultra-long-chain fatty acid omega-hydroxylase-like [Liolophura sinensis]|uniref:ultra-long-chain fatty acid omega-hydroxylase-like n=1 Tax=Liolophura sinensis TaxID=3198878 RepID=UPI0031594982